jgi:hypothetical protein
MSKIKLTATSVYASHAAAADAVLAANKHRDAFVARLDADLSLAAELVGIIMAVRQTVKDGSTSVSLDAVNRDKLEPTANSYGYTLVDHPGWRGRVVVQQLEAA